MCLIRLGLLSGVEQGVTRYCLYKFGDGMLLHSRPLLGNLKNLRIWSIYTSKCWKLSAEDELNIVLKASGKDSRDFKNRRFLPVMKFFDPLIFLLLKKSKMALYPKMIV